MVPPHTHTKTHTHTHFFVGGVVGFVKFFILSGLTVVDAMFTNNNKKIVTVEIFNEVIIFHTQNSLIILEEEMQDKIKIPFFQQH